jgi:molybdate transport system substrate-binding protein
MEIRLLAAARIAFAGALVLSFPAQSFAQVKVIISGGFRTAYQELLPQFERVTGISVVTASGASRGSGSEAIGAQLGRGVPADVVIMNRPGLDELIEGGKIIAGTDLDLAKTPTGVAVRAGTPKPDISTVTAFRQTLLRAKVVAVTSSNASSIKELLSRLGVAGEVEVKVGGRFTESIAMVARGDAVLAIQPVSEILHLPGVELAGTVPTELRPPAVYAAAIVSGSKELDASKRLIEFLSSDSATAAIKRSGMEPLGRR